MPRHGNRHAQLCVLRIRPDVLDLDGVAVTDGNAAGGYVRIQAAIDGLDFIRTEWVFARDWTDDDTITYWRKKSARCAEVLVPDVVPPDLIAGAYACRHASERLSQVAPSLDVVTDDDLVFCVGG